MKNCKIVALLVGICVFATPALVFHMPQARADDSAEMRGFLLGSWKSEAGDYYAFHPNGTYSFRAGASKRATGNLSHSGTWRVSNDGETLNLRATRRVVIEGRRKRTLRANKRFALTLHASDTPDSELINGENFIFDAD